MALSGNCMIPPLGECCQPNFGRRIVRVSVPGLQGPPGQKGSQGFSCRFCSSLDPEQTASLTNLQPAVGAQAVDQVVNSSGQLFLITAVSESTFTVGEVVGTVGVQIDDERDGPDTTWSGAKLAAHFGEPHDFVQTFEAALSESNFMEKINNG